MYKTKNNIGKLDTSPNVILGMQRTKKTERGWWWIDRPIVGRCSMTLGCLEWASCASQSNSARCWWFCSHWSQLAQSPTRSLASAFIQALYMLASSPLQIFEYLVETAPKMFDHKKHKKAKQFPSKQENRYIDLWPMPVCKNMQQFTLDR